MITGFQGFGDTGLYRIDSKDKLAKFSSFVSCNLSTFSDGTSEIEISQRAHSRAENTEIIVGFWGLQTALLLQFTGFF